MIPIPVSSLLSLARAAHAIRPGEAAADGQAGAGGPRSGHERPEGLQRGAGTYGRAGGGHTRRSGGGKLKNQLKKNETRTSVVGENSCHDAAAGNRQMPNSCQIHLALLI